MTTGAHLTDPDPDEDEEQEDPILKARLDHAVVPFLDLFPPEDIDGLRDLAAEFLTGHPVAVRLMDRLRERPVPASSGERPVRDPGKLAEAAKSPGERKRRIAG
jgi:hypothetical protein